MKEKNLLGFLLYSFVIVMLCISSFLFATYDAIYVNRDAGVYIPIAKEVLAGATPTVDVKTIYTPFIYYTYSLWMKIFGYDFETSVMLVYMANAICAILLFLILKIAINIWQIRMTLALLYFCSSIIAQGCFIVLEPFQIMFLLLAVLFYLNVRPISLRYLLIGFSLGISIMYKQYSMFALVGFLLVILIREISIHSLKRAIVCSLLMLVSSAIPYLLFIAFTDAELINSLYSFGFLGNWAINYVSQPGSVVDLKDGDFAFTLGKLLLKCINYNWLFIPLILLPILSKSLDRDHWTILILWICMAIPLLIRQHGHYFLLIAPWSFILWGVLLQKFLPFSEVMRNKKRYLVFIVCTTLATTLLFFFVKADHYQESVIILIGCLILIYFTKRPWFSNSYIVFVVSFLLIFEISLFATLYFPINQMQQRKIRQIKEAERLNKIVPSGSEVFVINHPSLYVTADLKNPVANYDFIWTIKRLREIVNDDLAIVKTIVLKPKGKGISGELYKLGYTEKYDTKKLNLKVFYKSQAHD